LDSSHLASKCMLQGILDRRNLRGAIAVNNPFQALSTELFKPANGYMDKIETFTAQVLIYDRHLTQVETVLHESKPDDPDCEMKWLSQALGEVFLKAKTELPPGNAMMMKLENTPCGRSEGGDCRWRACC
jgi:hypothetical protein